jgi:hypothetical protein
MARFEWHDAAIDELLTGPTGPVMAYVREFADAVAEAAKVRAPVGLDNGGELRDLIEVSTQEIVPGRTIRLKVGTDPIDPTNGFGYGLVAHEGHGVIFAKPGRNMAFYWAREDRFVDDFRMVKPTSGSPFLTEALKAVNFASARRTLLITAEGFRLEPGEHDGPIG